MHSWALALRKTTTQIRGPAASNLKYRLVSTRSNSSLLGSSRKGQREEYNKNEDWGEKTWLLGSFLRSICYGAVVIGSSSAIGCTSSLFEVDSSLAYADSGSQITQTEKKPTFLFKDTYRRKVFFKYEKRIRTQSPPEKVFEYFASSKTPYGEVCMSPADLMRAVVPVFPPSGAEAVRVGFLKGELVTSDLRCPPSEFFMLFDTDNDGLISFPEYIFFVTILGIPESSFSAAFKMFDIDGDGGIDKQEFKKVMSLMRTQNRQGASHRDGKRLGLKVSGSVDDGGLLEYFFGKDGNERLGHDRFVEFLRELHDEMLRLEFRHYDFNLEGTISAKDFILSMVSAADIRYINKFLNRVDELNNEPSLSNLCVTFEEFKNFAQLRRKLEPFSVALFSYGKVNGLMSKQDFKRAAHQVCGVYLTDKVVDLVFFMFDENRDGNLSSNEFLRVMESRETDISKQAEAGIGGCISCWMDCTRNCSSLKRFL